MAIGKAGLDRFFNLHVEQNKTEMIRVIYLIAAAAMVLSACSQEKKLEDELFKEVMDIHDEVMPEMGTLRSLSKSIQVKIDSLEMDSVNYDDTKRSELEQLVKKLKEAKESMMEWMRQFEHLEEGTPHGEVMKYLKEQKRMIEKVRDDMLEARKEGEYYLDK